MHSASTITLIKASVPDGLTNIRPFPPSFFSSSMIALKRPGSDIRASFASFPPDCQNFSVFADMSVLGYKLRHGLPHSDTTLGIDRRKLPVALWSNVQKDKVADCSTEF